ncbi:hypothetical protein BDN71DRAFT_333006 [Pleurotus eryngii]|uniref:Uncharacterized protein n=1 Tax=Pleurotus eryngii TaxID=5323 RepID=A0A9P5ZJ73_PLEER|nr:hypothetical protein BDN71DRAFT_333006 [Pleurotus eryngii]
MTTETIPNATFTDNVEFARVSQNMWGQRRCAGNMQTGAHNSTQTPAVAASPHFVSSSMSSTEPEAGADETQEPTTSARPPHSARHPHLMQPLPTHEMPSLYHPLPLLRASVTLPRPPKCRLGEATTRELPGASTPTSCWVPREAWFQPGQATDYLKQQSSESTDDLPRIQVAAAEVAAEYIRTATTTTTTR